MHASDEFQTYMKGKQIKAETIKELCEMGFDSFKTVLLVKEADIQMMKAPPGQRRLLGIVVDEYKKEITLPYGKYLIINTIFIIRNHMICTLTF